MVTPKSRLGCVLLFTVALWTTSAQAEWQLGVGLATGLDVGELAVEPGDGMAAGLGGRLGYFVDLPGVDLMPEMTVSYLRFPEDEAGNAPQALTATRFGARLQLGTLVSPAIFGHVGYASLEGEAEAYVLERAGWSYDFGAAVEVEVLMAMRVGAHASWNELFPDGHQAISWAQVGAHVSFDL